MMNMKVILEATDIAIVEYDFAGEVVNTSTVKEQVIDWYNHTDIVLPELLAAAVLAFGHYKASITLDNVEEACNFFFPQTPVEYCNYSIEEIEMAMIY